MFLLSLVALLLASPLYAKDPHAPVFPRTEVELKATDRFMDELTETVYGLMDANEKAKIDELLHGLDRSNRDDRAEVMKQARFSIDIVDIFIKTCRKAIEEKIIVSPSKEFVPVQCGMTVKDSVKDGVNFGARYHIHMEFAVKKPRKPKNDPQISYVAIAFTNSAVVKYEGKEVPDTHILDSKAIETFADKKGKWVGAYVKGGQGVLVYGAKAHGIIWPKNKAGQVINGKWTR